MPPGSKKRKAAKKKKEMEENHQQPPPPQPEEEEEMAAATQLPSSQGNGHHNGKSKGDSLSFGNDSANGHLIPHHEVGKASEVGPLQPPSPLTPPPQDDPSHNRHLRPRSNLEKDGELQSQAHTKKHKKMEANGHGEVAAAVKEEVLVEEAPLVETEDKSEPLNVPSEAEDQKDTEPEKPAVIESMDAPAEQVFGPADEVEVEVVKEVPAEVMEDVKQENIEVPAEVVKEATDEGEEVQAVVAEEVTAESKSLQAEVAEVATAERNDVLTEVAEEALMVVVPPPLQDREVKVVPIDAADDETVDKTGETSRAIHAIATAATSVTTEVAHQPPLVKRTTWWNCCGLLDVLVGSD